jgi:hypothetical protein
MMNWLILSWALTMSWLPTDIQTIIQYPTGDHPIIESSGCYSINLEARADILKHMKIWGNVETYEKTNPDIILSFKPFRADYIVGMALYDKNIEAGIMHECDHGVESSQKFDPWYGLVQTRIYIKISGSTR